MTMINASAHFAVRGICHGHPMMAEVKVEVLATGNATAKSPVTFAEGCWKSVARTEEFEAAARFGALYALNKHNRLEAKNCVVAKFLIIRGHDFDTTPLAVALASAVATCRALDLPANAHPFLDAERAIVCFPV